MAKTRTQLISDAVIEFADNTAGAITAQDLRTFLIDLIDSGVLVGTNNLLEGEIGKFTADGNTVEGSSIFETATEIEMRKNMSCPDDSGLSVGGSTFVGMGANLAFRQPEGDDNVFVTHKVTDDSSVFPQMHFFGVPGAEVSQAVTTDAIGATRFQWVVDLQFARRVTRLTLEAPDAQVAIECDLIVRLGSHTSTNIIYQYTRATGGTGFMLRPGRNTIATQAQIDLAVDPAPLPGLGFAHEASDDLYITVERVDGSTFQLEGDDSGVSFIPYNEWFGQPATLFTLVTASNADSAGRPPGPGSMLVSSAWKDLWVVVSDGTPGELGIEAENDTDTTRLPVTLGYLQVQNYVTDANYVHTDNNFTDARATKLDGLIAHFQGVFANAAARDAAITSPQTGWTAFLLDVNFPLPPVAPGLTYYNGTAWVSTGSTNTGDMLASVYDPTAIAGDVFDMDNMVEGTTTKIMTDAERTKLGLIPTPTQVGQILTWAGAAFVAEELLSIDPDGTQGNVTVNSGQSDPILWSATKGYVETLAAATNPRYTYFGLQYQALPAAVDHWRFTTLSGGLGIVGVDHDNTSTYFAITEAEVGDWIMIISQVNDGDRVVGKVTAAATNPVASRFETVLNLSDYQQSGTFINGEPCSFALLKTGAVDGVTTFLALTDTIASYTGAAGDLLGVNTGEDGLALFTQASITQEIVNRVTGIYDTLKFLEPQLPDDPDESHFVPLQKDPINPILTWDGTGRADVIGELGRNIALTDPITLSVADGDEIDNYLNVTLGLTGTFTGTNGPEVIFELYEPGTNNLIVEFRCHYRSVIRTGLNPANRIQWQFGSDSIVQGDYPATVGTQLRMVLDRTYTTVPSQIAVVDNRISALTIVDPVRDDIYTDHILDEPPPSTHIPARFESDGFGTLSVGTAQTQTAVIIVSAAFAALAKAYNQSENYVKFEIWGSGTRDAMPQMFGTFTEAELISQDTVIAANMRQDNTTGERRLLGRIFTDRNQLGGVAFGVNTLQLTPTGIGGTPIYIQRIVGIKATTISG